MSEQQCYCRCCAHGISDLDDRIAAFESGRAAGIVEGRLGQLENDLDVRALREAADLLQWVRTRTLALIEGPSWAAEVAGDKPEVTQ